MPLGYQAAMAQLQQVDRSIEEAASNLGARGLHLPREVYVPLLARAFAEGFTLSFVRAVTNVSIAVFLVSPGNVVATFAILNMIGNGIWGGAAALTTMLLVVTFTGLALARLAAGRALRPVGMG
ncbi:MAG: ABC transporter permease subunit [Armatimonadetes bacterium]|nr:ABC transporter permease subunit [Armatimonadota bacterium]MDW8152835.1 ABC transporter permease subunit [Armatimonadota bacterium]